jgi:AraC-like DNA-binding protein/tetratricopeptide (TPR) repeat protein
MRRKTVALSALFLSVLSLAGSTDGKSRIAAAQGREKLVLILKFLQDSDPTPKQEEEKLAFISYAAEAQALSRQLSDRHAQGLAEMYVAHGEYLYQQYEPALETYFLSRQIFRELADREHEADIDRRIGDLLPIVIHVFSDLGRAGDYYARSLAVARQKDDPVAIMKNLMNLADSYRARSDFRRAIPLCLEALQLSERSDIHLDSGALLNNLSDMCLKTGDSAAAMKYVQQALDFYKKKRLAQASGRACTQKGFLYMQQNDFNRALVNFQHALAIHTKLAEPARAAGELRNLGRLYSQFGQNAKARDYFQQEQALRRQLSDRNEIIQYVQARAVALQKQNELARAEALLLYCETRARQSHLQLKLEEIYLQMASLYRLRRDPVKALYYETLGKRSKDSLPGATMAAGIQKIMAKQEKDKEIKDLTKRKRRQSVAGMLAIGLLVALAGLVAARRKAIRRWSRNHLVSKDQRLQKKKAQLLDMRQKMDALREPPVAGGASPPGTDDRGREYLRLVMKCMQQDELFLDSELTLKKTAARVGANSSSLSKALNENQGMGFSDFVNHFRIEKAKEIMAADVENKWDVVDVCYEAGFNSLSSFYRVFRVHTGTTPSEFLRAGRNS